MSMSILFDDVESGEIEEGREYTEKDFNRIIEIKEREEYRVKLFLKMINQKQKTLVFVLPKYMLPQ